MRFYRDEDGDKSDGDPITSAIVDMDGNDLVYVPIRQAGPLFVYPSIPVKVRRRSY